MNPNMKKNKVLNRNIKIAFYILQQKVSLIDAIDILYSTEPDLTTSKYTIKNVFNTFLKNISDDDIIKINIKNILIDNKIQKFKESSPKTRSVISDELRKEIVSYGMNDYINHSSFKNTINKYKICNSTVYKSIEKYGIFVNIKQYNEYLQKMRNKKKNKTYKASCIARNNNRIRSISIFNMILEYNKSNYIVFSSFIKEQHPGFNEKEIDCIHGYIRQNLEKHYPDIYTEYCNHKANVCDNVIQDFINSEDYKFMTVLLKEKYPNIKYPTLHKYINNTMDHSSDLYINYKRKVTKG